MLNETFGLDDECELAGWEYASCLFTYWEQKKKQTQLDLHKLPQSYGIAAYPSTPVAPSTLSYCASTSKAFTAAALSITNEVAVPKPHVRRSHTHTHVSSRPSRAIPWAPPRPAGYGKPLGMTGTYFGLDGALAAPEHLAGGHGHVWGGGTTRYGRAQPAAARWARAGGGYRCCHHAEDHRIARGGAGF